MTFFFTDPATTEIYTLSLHDALPISRCARLGRAMGGVGAQHLQRIRRRRRGARSEEHTSELQSRLHLVCRLLLEKKNKRHECRAAIPATTQRNAACRCARLDGISEDH